CTRRRRLLSHAVLAIPPRGNCPLYCGAASQRARNLGALPAPAIQLEGGRAAAACARLEHPLACCHPYRRRAAWAELVPTRKSLSAGALCVLDRKAPFHLADVRRHDHRLGAWLHRPTLLAPHEGILRAQRALSACGSGADPGACHSRSLSGRTKRHRRQRRPAMEGGEFVRTPCRDTCPTAD